MVKVGDALPATTLYVIRDAGKGPEPTTLPELFDGASKGVLFGVPGAFSPGCSRTHLPGYVRDFEKIRSEGGEKIVCVAVNDPFVCKAWETSEKAEGKVLVVADPVGELAQALDLVSETYLPIFGNKRLRRFSAVVKDGKIAALNVEPPKGGLSCSLSNVILKQLKEV